MNEPLKNLYNKVFFQKLSLEITKVYKEFDHRWYEQFAQQKGIGDVTIAVEKGMKEKAAEFKQQGSEIYQ